MTTPEAPDVDALPVGWTVETNVPLDTLIEHPRNPRRGDTKKIEASIKAHGFVDAVVAQVSTRHLLHGNHKSRVALKLGHTHAPVVLWADVDDDEAMRLLLAYNRAADESDYDRNELLAVTRALLDTDGGLDGSLFDTDDVDQLRRLTGELAEDSLDFLDDFGRNEPGAQKQHDWTREAGGLEQTFTLSFPYDETTRNRVMEILALAKAKHETPSSAVALAAALEEWWTGEHAEPGQP